MENEVERLKVFVGKDREIKTLFDCFFEYGFENLEIYIDEGEYSENINFINSKNILVNGLGKVVLYGNNTSTIKIENSDNIEISNIIIKNDSNSCIEITNSNKIELKDNIILNAMMFGVIVSSSTNILLYNNLIINNNMGLSSSDSSINIINNTIINNKSFNLSILSINKNILYFIKEQLVNISKNIVKSPIGTILVTNLKSIQNICISEDNIENIRIAGFHYKNLNFIDEKNENFVIKEKKLSEIGASKQILNKYYNYINNLLGRKLITLIEEKRNVNLKFFFNISLNTLIQEYSNILNNKNINFNIIDTKEDIKKLDSLFIINALDEREDKETLFEIINEAINLKKVFYIFIPSEKYTVPTNQINLEKMPSILETKKILLANYPDNIIYYDDLEDLVQKIYEKINTESPKITINKLILENISHFNNLEIDFKNKNNCFIGLNGTGKTTILRSIALALIGNEHKNLIQKNVKNFLKIYGLNNHLINRKSGKITLKYNVDDKEFINYVEFNLTSDNDIEIKYVKDPNFDILHGDFIKSLIIGFTQNRGILKISENDLKQRSEVQLPHINDLIPLINNEGDNRLKSFSTWIINLDVKANKIENEALKNNNPNIYIKEKDIINKIFIILSEIIEENITFKEVINNNDVWISTKSNPEGISLELVSQGFQSIIGWIGFFLQRMAESYSESKDFTNEPAICFVDELDIYIHPKWQKNILSVLEKYFPNTQFITTTHSPLVIGNLKTEKTNVYRIEQDNVQEIFSYGKDINSILFEAYGVEKRPHEIQVLIDDLYKEIENENILEAKNILDNLKTLISGSDPDIIEAEAMLFTLED